MNAVLAYFDRSDRRMSGRLQGWRPPRWFRVLMVWSTRLGDGWLWFGAFVPLVVRAAEGGRILAAASTSAVLANIALVCLKRRLRRQRPVDGGSDWRLSSANPDLFAFDRFSFPSGHATNAFAACTVYGLAYPLLALPLLAVAASVSVSRVVLGRHFLSDVAAGACLGAFAGLSAVVLLLG